MTETKRPRWKTIAGGIVVTLLVAHVAAVANGVVCGRYGDSSFRPPEASATQAEVPPPARLVDGTLCLASGTCMPAVLAQGMVSAETVALVRARAQHTSGVLTVCMNSVGGRADREIQDPLPHNVHTCVADLQQLPNTPPFPAVCDSACAWLWMAGRERTLYGTSTIGLHRPFIYDAPACAPGNWLNAALHLAIEWVNDQKESRYSDRERAARRHLRMASMSKGPQEVYVVDGPAAVQLGLQQRAEGPGVFRPNPPVPPQPIASDAHP